MKHKPYKFTIVITRDLSPINPAKAKCDACGKLFDNKDIVPSYGPVDVGEYFICRECSKSKDKIDSAIKANRRSIRISIELNR